MVYALSCLIAVRNNIKLRWFSFIANVIVHPSVLWNNHYQRMYMYVCVSNFTNHFETNKFIICLLPSASMTSDKISSYLFYEKQFPLQLPFSETQHPVSLQIQSFNTKSSTGHSLTFKDHYHNFAVSTNKTQLQGVQTAQNQLSKCEKKYKETLLFTCHPILIQPMFILYLLIAMMYTYKMNFCKKINIVS